MKDLNRVSLIGNLAADPEKRETKSGKVVCTFPLATHRSLKGENNERKGLTDFHRITAWSKQAETVSQYLKKGRRVLVEGRLRNNSYKDKDGNNRYSTEVVMSTFFFLDSTKAAAAPAA